MNARQLSFLHVQSFRRFRRLSHGGALNVGKRKLERPIDPKRPLHLVIRATQAKGSWSMLHPKNVRMTRRLVDRLAQDNGVRVYQYANSGNHLHLLIKTRTRKGFQRFLRSLAGILARMITGARKGRPMGKFWDALAFTRVVEWGLAFRRARFYVLKNELEAAGVWFRPAGSPGRPGSRGGVPVRSGRQLTKNLRMP